MMKGENGPVLALQYLVSQSLRWGVTNPTAVSNTYELCTELQYMGERQVANVGVLLTVNTRTLFYNSSEHTVTSAISFRQELKLSHQRWINII